jgi:hypothetical protein
MLLMPSLPLPPLSDFFFQDEEDLLLLIRSAADRVVDVGVRGPELERRIPLLPELIWLVRLLAVMLPMILCFACILDILEADTVFWRAYPEPRDALEPRAEIDRCLP